MCPSHSSGPPSTKSSLPSDADTMCGVDPVWWTPQRLRRRCSDAEESSAHRRSSGARWWSWFAPDARRRSCRESSNRLRRRSGTGRQAERDEGRREDGLTSAERDERPPAAREPPAASGARHPGKGGSLVRAGDRHDCVRVFHFMSANQAVFPIAVMARVLGVSIAGYYAWRRRHRRPGPRPMRPC